MRLFDPFAYLVITLTGWLKAREICMIDCGIPDPPKLSKEDLDAQNNGHERRYIINILRRQVLEHQIQISHLQEDIEKLETGGDYAIKSGRVILK